MQSDIMPKRKDKMKTIDRAYVDLLKDEVIPGVIFGFLVLMIGVEMVNNSSPRSPIETSLFIGQGVVVAGVVILVSVLLHPVSKFFAYLINKIYNFISNFQNL